MFLPAIFSIAMAVSNPVEPICMPIEALARILLEDHGERIAGVGKTEGDMRVLLFASKDGRTWTLAMLGSNGVACVGPTGSNWRTPRRGA